MGNRCMPNVGPQPVAVATESFQPADPARKKPPTRDQFIPMETRRSIQRRFFEMELGIAKISTQDRLPHSVVEAAIREGARIAARKVRAIEFTRRAA